MLKGLALSLAAATSWSGCHVSSEQDSMQPPPQTLGGACACEMVRCAGASSTCQEGLTCLFGECVAEACESDGSGCSTPDTVCTVFGNENVTFHYCAWDGMLEGESESGSAQ